jgi:hypothetical protein
MKGKYCMCIGTQLNAFHASKLFVWLNYVKSPSTKKNMNHEKHLTPEKVSTSTNLNICNILLHGKTTIVEIERQFWKFKYFLLCHYIIDCVVKFPCVQ